jgi:hypothetical protein
MTESAPNSNMSFSQELTVFLHYPTTVYGATYYIGVASLNPRTMLFGALGLAANCVFYSLIDRAQ